MADSDLFPNIYLHASDRSALDENHPDRMSLIRRALYQTRLIQKPAKSDKFGIAKHDYLEDILRVSVGSAGLAWIACLFKGGHATRGSLIWTTPQWANRLLFQVRMIRYYSKFWAAGAAYFTTYNFLTGYLGWPTTQYGKFNPEASTVAAAPLGFLWALASQSPNRALAGRPGSLFGRSVLCTIGACGLAYFWAKFTYHGNDRMKEPFEPTTDSYVYQFRTNQPGPDVVNKIPYLPFYKEAKAYPMSGVKNPLYDPEAVAKVQAETRRVVDEHC
uniref:Uncharacterized protein n=1 Tax=Eutreptiella gymnastica TaxID=73025 RepID=A0A7S1IXK6_9EUGL